MALLWFLVRLNRAGFQWRRLLLLHADEGGSAQALSFVLTLPIFVWVMLFIVQVSQLMIATIAVNYAAFAAARSAIVWIPANIAGVETENCVAGYTPDLNAQNLVPVLDPTAPNYGPAQGAGDTYIVSAKRSQVHQDPVGSGARSYGGIAVKESGIGCSPGGPVRDKAC